MLGDILDFMDDMTGNVVSDFSRFHDKRQYQREMNKPQALIARKKIDLYNQMVRAKDGIERNKGSYPSLVEMYTKDYNDAKELLEALR